MDRHVAVTLAWRHLEFVQIDDHEILRLLRTISLGNFWSDHQKNLVKPRNRVCAERTHFDREKFYWDQDSLLQRMHFVAVLNEDQQCRISSKLDGVVVANVLEILLGLVEEPPVCDSFLKLEGPSILQEA